MEQDPRMLVLCVAWVVRKGVSTIVSVCSIARHLNVLRSDRTICVAIRLRDMGHYPFDHEGLWSMSGLETHFWQQACYWVCGWTTAYPCRQSGHTSFSSVLPGRKVLSSILLVASATHGLESVRRGDELVKECHCGDWDPNIRMHCGHWWTLTNERTHNPVNSCNLSPQWSKWPA